MLQQLRRDRAIADEDKGAKNICKAITRSVNCAFNVSTIHILKDDYMKSRPAITAPLRFLMVLFHQGLDSRECLWELEWQLDFCIFNMR